VFCLVIGSIRRELGPVGLGDLLTVIHSEAHAG
jgi:hypothetical protein